MFVYDRPVRFEDVDAARIVFFGRFSSYCHDAMEAFFDGALGGYVGLINDRKIGFPVVHVEADFTAPLRYGDVARIEVTVMRVGRTSCAFRFDVSRKADRANIAAFSHVCVATNLTSLEKVPLPDDVRALLESHAHPPFE